MKVDRELINTARVFPRYFLKVMHRARNGYILRDQLKEDLREPKTSSLCQMAEQYAERASNKTSSVGMGIITWGIIAGNIDIGLEGEKSLALLIGGLAIAFSSFVLRPFIRNVYKILNPRKSDDFSSFMETAGYNL